MEVGVLGPVELIDGTSVVRLTRAERTVLAALAARVGERVPVDVLEEALWPQQRPPSARKSLQGHIVRLRRVLGPAAIVERDGSYRLDPDHVGVDAERVAGLLAEGRAAVRRGDPEVAVGLLAEARLAFRGAPYDGVSETAVPAGEVPRLEELRATVVEEAVEAELARGCGEQCIGDVEAFVQANPYRERAWGQLMVALYQAGRPADALAAYGRARVLLAAELGIEPGPALRDIEQAILTHDRRLLKAVTAPAELGPSNLPAALSPLIGRQRELATLEAASLSERLVTLTGVGGIGKTRLAIELATQTAGRDKLGPYFVDLAPIGDIELVPAAIAAAFGVLLEPNADVMALVRSALADHSVVVVLDNCEHLLPAIAELVGALLSSGPGIRVVATSREPLGVAGERVCPVDPLRVPPASASIDEIESSDAGVLFLARLPMSLTTGPLSHGEVAAVGTICRSLDGIPLGLELAAAHSRTLSLPELADRLDHTISELAPPRHGVTARHRTMRAALDWGYQLLTPSAQAALRAMSVFAGGCDLSAFATVCRDDEDRPVVDVLDELVRTSFVTTDFGGERTRYRLLEPVRQYARGLLDDRGDATNRHRRHLDHYLGVATGLTRDVDGLGLTRFDDLRPELGNFRAALDWSASDAEGTDAGLTLASRLSELWTSQAHHQEGLSRLVGLLASGAGSTDTRSEAAYTAGFIAEDLGDDDQAVALWEQALAEAQAGGDSLGEARARRMLSLSVFDRGDIAAARHHLETAIRISIDKGNDALHAYCMLDVSELLMATGELNKAGERIRAVLDGNLGTVASVEVKAHELLSWVRFEHGDYADARALNAKVVSVAVYHSMLHYLVLAHRGLAEVEWATGNLDEADVQIALAEELNPDTARGADAALLRARAEVALRRDQPAEALTLAEQATTLIDETRDKFPFIFVLRVLGDAQLALNRPDDALTTFQRLIVRTGEASYLCRLAEGHEGAAAAAAALGQRQDAHDHLAAAAEIRHHTGSRRIRRPVVEQHLTRLEAERRDPVPLSNGRSVISPPEIVEAGRPA